MIFSFDSLQFELSNRDTLKNHNFQTIDSAGSKLISIYDSWKLGSEIWFEDHQVEEEVIEMEDWMINPKDWLAPGIILDRYYRKGNQK